MPHIIHHNLSARFSSNNLTTHNLCHIISYNTMDYWVAIIQDGEFVLHNVGLLFMIPPCRMIGRICIVSCVSTSTRLPYSDVW